MSNINQAAPIQREKFGSRMTFVLASIGGAMGLGNVWKFPYVTGKYGGAAFIIVYLIALLFIAVPVLMTEFAIGRKTQTGYTGALKQLFPGTKWHLLGLAGIACLAITLSFYTGIAGWTIAYFFKSISGIYMGQGPDVVASQFGAFVSDPLQTTLWLTVMMILTVIIVVKGIKGGIEKACNILLPVFFILIIILGIQTVTLPGADAGVEFFLKPDFSSLTGEAVMAAIGQAFFTLGVGCGNLVIYGSYLDKKKSITSSTIMVGLGDTLVAILFGFIIFPAVFAFGIEPTMGPPLVFITLPTVFAQMKFGQIFGTAFFFLLFAACITSTICILEAIVGFAVDDLKMSRKKATYISAGLVWVLGIVQMMSFGPMADVMIFGRTFFDFCNDILVSAFLLPVGGLMMVLLVGWKLKPKVLVDEINEGEGLKINKYYTITVKYIAPIAIILMLLQLTGILKF